MCHFHQLTSDERSNIALLLDDGYSIRGIARRLHKAPSTISREIKRNRFFNDKKELYYPDCKRLISQYSVCNGCKNKSNCIYRRFFYDNEYARELTYKRRHNANKKPRIDDYRFSKIIDALYKLVVLNGQSIEAAWHADTRLQTVSTLTLRRWISKYDTPIKNAYLRRKKRLHIKKQYDYTAIKSTIKYSRPPFRTMSDYKQFRKDNPDAFVIQTDSIEGKRNDKQAILTMFFEENKVQLGKLYERNEGSIKIYNQLKKLSLTLLKSIKDRYIVFLTDNGIEFSMISKLEELNERIKVFYTRAYCSTDKAGCERNHEFFRYIYPKGKSLDLLIDEKVDEIFANINSYIRDNLNWESPCQVMTRTYGENLTKALDITPIMSKDVNLRSLF